jgi:hypothetical protein
VPELVGSEPSVVYLTWLRPEPLPSLALSVTPIGVVLFQPAALAAGVSAAVAVGAVVSITIPALACEAT